MRFKNYLIAFFIIGILGTLGHFLYGWTNENTIIGYFFPINESTWEHLKLLFFPTIIYSIFEKITLKNNIQNYTSSVVFSSIIGMISIVVLFYTYKGVLGYNVDFINISIYYLSLIIMLIFKNKIINKEIFSSQYLNYIALFLAFIITLLFVFFTYNPPSINLFVSPI
jgi:hypothetical protein